MNTNNNRNT